MCLVALSMCWYFILRHATQTLVRQLVMQVNLLLVGLNRQRKRSDTHTDGWIDTPRVLTIACHSNHTSQAEDHTSVTVQQRHNMFKESNTDDDDPPAK